MGVRVLFDAEQEYACMYCSTTMYAFGPIFSGWENVGAEEECEAFIKWVFAKHGDPRRYEDGDLERFQGEFFAERPSD